MAYSRGALSITKLMCTIKVFLCLPISALLLQIILCSLPTSSFSFSPRKRSTRLWTPLRASGDAYEDASTTSESDGSGHLFERIVRKVTQNEDYQFGDITKKVLNTTTHGVEDAVKTVTGIEEYQFGDLTKKVVGSTASGFEGVVKTVTRNEDYQFGDLSKKALGAAGSALTYSEKTLSLMRDANIHELVELLNLFWNRSMNENERKEAFTVIVYLGAIAVLAYNFVANVMTGMVFAATWAKFSMQMGVSPISPGMWTKFLEAKTTMDLFFGGPWLPARALITIPWFFRYRKVVVAMANRSPLRQKFPIINRYLSLILTWIIANLGFVGGVTYLMVKIGSTMTGVPMFPVAP